MTAAKPHINRLLSLFKGRCGHTWVGATGGSFGCPVCGDREGDHHLVYMDEIPVQPEDWGCAWGDLKEISDKLCADAEWSRWATPPPKSSRRYSREDRPGYGK